jgi:endogenous inhibitor of DNA gyrase (YacG/DUF329 family)
VYDIDMIKLKCHTCKNVIYRRPSEIRSEYVFCDRKCKDEWHKTIKTYWEDPHKASEARRKISLNHADVSASNNPKWNGGKCVSRGYIYLLRPDHPHRNNNGYVREHRLVMEEKLGRYLDPSEIVHHINGVVDDNRIENLKLYALRGKHIFYHAKVRSAKFEKKRYKFKCNYCGKKISRIKSLVKNNNTSNFYCSRGCYYKKIKKETK